MGKNNNFIKFKNNEISLIIKTFCSIGFKKINYREIDRLIYFLYTICQ